MNEAPSEALHLTGRFTSAVDYARTLHIERRKGTDIPYMAHLLGVTALVMAEAGHASVPVTEDMLIAALLHDAVEDHGGRPRLEDIKQNFGGNVARLVEGLTDSFSSDSEHKGPWEHRKRAYIERLKTEPADVRLISAADKLYNAKSMLDDYRVIGPECGSGSTGRGQISFGTSMRCLRFSRSPPGAGRRRNWSGWLLN